MSRCGGSIRSAIGPLLHSSILFRPHQQPRPATGLMVEAPGYCPPGPKCLFHPTVYRHSRLPGTRINREFCLQSQGLGCYGRFGTELVGERKLMKKLVFIVTGIAALGLAGCSSNNQDAVNNAELNQPQADNLNELS